MEPAAIIIPIKTPVLAKSRLRPVLDDARRERLVRCLIGDTIEAALGAARFRGVTVATNDRTVADQAERRGCAVVFDGPCRDLSAVLRAAIDARRAAWASCALILPIDLPYVTAAALDTLHRDHPQRGVTVGRARRDRGTTILLCPTGPQSPPAFGLAFGRPASADLHRDAAAAAGWAVRLADADPFDVDLDVPDDLRQLDAARCGTRLRRFLADDRESGLVNGD